MPWSTNLSWSDFMRSFKLLFAYVFLVVGAATGCDPQPVSGTSDAEIDLSSEFLTQIDTEWGLLYGNVDGVSTSTLGESAPWLVVPSENDRDVFVALGENDIVIVRLRENFRISGRTFH